MFKIFNKSIFEDRRRELRNRPTKHEYILWKYLKNKNLGVRFNRQYGIGSYIVDFYCKEKNLIIELDGQQHKLEKEYDIERDNYLNSLGCKVLRFWNGEVEDTISDVLKKIRNYL